jgi:flagellar M-ring protein FliF
MWQQILTTLREFGEQWNKMSVGRKASLGIGFVVAVACLMALGVWVGEKSYAPLYTNLQPENSIALVKILQEERIPYLVSNDGGTVSIPPEFIQPTLMKLAVRGTPGGQKPGMELFDKESFGTSSYVQRINYVRALQGELTRTINTLTAVRKSSIHISMPPKSTFLETAEDPKASVVIDLHPGKTITKEEVRGIQNLVANSVEGLRYERVTVVEATGRALSVSGDALSSLTQTMLEKQKTIESNLERRVEDIVGRIAGQGNIVARVNAELDFDPVREQETLFDPEQTALKAQEKQENTMDASRSGPAAPPAAGAQAALPTPAPASTGPESRQAVAKSTDRQDFEVSSKIRNREKALGAVKRLSVAVLLNQEAFAARAPAKEGEAAQPTGPTEDQKRAIEKLVRDAVGFVEGRDSVTIEASAFATEDFDKADDILSQQEQRALIFSIIRYSVVALFVLLFFMVVVRPFIRWVTGISTTKVETLLPKTVEELEMMQDTVTNTLPGLNNLPLLEETVDLEKAEGELLKERIVALIEQSPSKAAQIVSDWIAMSEVQPPKKRR